MKSENSTLEEKLIRDDIASLYYLHGTFKAAANSADSAFLAGDFNKITDADIWAQLFLRAVYRELKKNPIPDWYLKGTKECVQLSSERTCLTVRINKRDPFNESGLHSAGSSRTKQRAYSQGPLREESQLLHDMTGNPTLLGVVMFIVWSQNNDDSFTIIAKRPYRNILFKDDTPVSLEIPIETTPQKRRISTSQAPLWILGRSAQAKMRKNGDFVVNRQQNEDNE